MVYNGYYKVMSNIPKMGHVPTPVSLTISFPTFPYSSHIDPVATWDRWEPMSAPSAQAKPVTFKKVERWVDFWDRFGIIIGGLTNII